MKYSWTSPICSSLVHIHTSCIIMEAMPLWKKMHFMVILMKLRKATNVQPWPRNIWRYIGIWRQSCVSHDMQFKNPFYVGNLWKAVRDMHRRWCLCIGDDSSHWKPHWGSSSSQMASCKVITPKCGASPYVPQSHRGIINGTRHLLRRSRMAFRRNPWKIESQQQQCRACQLVSYKPKHIHVNVCRHINSSGKKKAFYVLDI